MPSKKPTTTKSVTKVPSKRFWTYNQMIKARLVCTITAYNHIHNKLCFKVPEEGEW